MKPIIEAVPKELIERELTEERLLRATNNAGNFIYTIKAAEAPDLFIRDTRVPSTTRKMRMPTL